MGARLVQTFAVLSAVGSDQARITFSPQTNRTRVRLEPYCDHLFNKQSRTGADVSVSFLKPVLHLFNNQVLKSQDDDTQLTTTIKGGILKYHNEKYDDDTTEKLLDMATLLDPRFKTTYIKRREGRLHEDKSCCRTGKPRG
ncbi:hypothetical protein SKAU_G00410580 [Synaphobranchus kaupii]|uniref:Uncharacterized protein n=1 Tax=Synaphobranchus kaupii TaxID=118154 RepID=A0A9Q1E7N5_SYNKA|nr:hypothetical protein SKAU_G00410580 [Synaphobranchus kaupii]